MYAPPIQAFCYILRFSLTFIGVKWTPVDKLTQNLGFSIPFHLYIHDHEDSEQSVHLVEGRTCTHPQYRHFATYYGFHLPLLGSNGHQLTN